MTKEQEFRKQSEEAKFEAFSLMCKKVADLEKENAELKEKLGDVQMQKAGEKSDLVWKLKTANEQKSKQLTKAKELLKWFVWYFREGSPNLVPYKHKVAEAEQFLNSDKPREEKEERKYYCKTCRDLMCPCSGTERYEINCSGVEED